MKAEKVLVYVAAAATLMIGSKGPQAQGDMTVPQYPDTGGSITVAVGKQFMLVLPADRAAGYSWQLAKPFDARVLRLMSASYWKQMRMTPGGAETEHWTFRAMNPGQTTIIVRYLRPWEKKPPARTLTYTISVQ